MKSDKVLVILTLHSLTTLCMAHSIDPGRMFKLDQDPLVDLDPLRASAIWASLSEKSWSKDDPTCSMGTGAVLKRIIKKLFNHVNTLQPFELDEEFIYESSITFEDYQKMTKYLDREELDCASLHGLDILLSKFITNSHVRRPSQEGFSITSYANIFDLDNFARSVFAPIILLALVVVSTIWILRLIGYSFFVSSVLGLIIVGFAQYYMESYVNKIGDDKERDLKCSDPSNGIKILNFFGWDYNNCKSLRDSTTDGSLSKPNIAFTVASFFSELAGTPMAKFLKKLGEGSQEYLNAFTGLSWWLANIMLVISIVCFTCFITFIVRHSISCIFNLSSRKRSVNGSRVGKTPAITSPRDRSLGHRGANSYTKKKRR